MSRKNQLSIKNWMLNEAHSAGKENLDKDHVSKYDQKEDASAEIELEFLKKHGLNESYPSW